MNGDSHWVLLVLVGCTSLAPLHTFSFVRGSPIGSDCLISSLVGLHPLTGERKEGLVNVVQGFGHVRANRDNFKGVTCCISCDW